ncbi:hypothetical protein [Alloalcanivorax profundimaris]|uniref:hypothetical protein n=1 Tax=Alloalcanivorax profundimaris TaxID=2735259 RepID=UPI001E29E933|nr:hypothetical protein [Alloalcanivorax profundimaris]
MNRGGFLQKARFFRRAAVVSERTVGFQIEGTVSLGLAVALAATHNLRRLGRGGGRAPCFPRKRDEGFFFQGERRGFPGEKPCPPWGKTAGGAANVKKTLKTND